jgi:hypothetical protein
LLSFHSIPPFFHLSILFLLSFPYTESVLWSQAEKNFESNLYTCIISLTQIPSSPNLFWKLFQLEDYISLRDTTFKN